MNNQEKIEALMTVARAYLDREVWVQYDQRAMDRIIQLTQRRAKSLPPEAATEEHTLFLDCSSYMFTLYREAFGFEFPSDLTWHMIDYLKPRVYFYTITKEETEEDKARVTREIKEALKPGDVITYDRHSGSGHTMLYIGNGKYTHCTTNFKRPNSYDYENRKSREYETGLWVDDVNRMIEERIFSQANNVRRIAIARPLDVVGEPTKNTIARMTEAKGLKLAVTSSHSKSRTAEVGDEIVYTLSVFSKEKKKIRVSFAAPNATAMVGTDSATFEIGENEAKTVTFTVKVTDNAANLAYIDGPRVTVNGLSVFTHQTLVGKKLVEGEVKEINKSAYEKKDSVISIIDAVRKEYERIGAKILANETEYIRNSFFMYDSTSGDLLYRKPQNPASDGAVYSMFGGKGVTTPENSAYPFIRTTKPISADFAPGDIIVISNDPYGVNCFSAYYTGTALIGKFEDSDEAISVRDGAQVAEFFDSLLGRFAFIVIRPALTK